MTRRSRSGSLIHLVLTLAQAVRLWRFVFRSERSNFWARMTLAAGLLGARALRARPEMRRETPRLRDLPEGALSAAGIYVVFQAGDRLARSVMPNGEQDIESVYQLRTLAPRPLVAFLLATIIGPSEELFWRGYVQHTLMRHWGKWRGTAAAAAGYGAIHLVTGNLTLTAAAGVAGVYWGAEYAIRPRLAPLLVSHVLWDIWIFLVRPTPGHRRPIRPPD